MTTLFILFDVGMYLHRFFKFKEVLHGTGNLDN